MTRRLARATALAAMVTLLAGCGGKAQQQLQGQQQLPAGYFRQPIPGAPAATPMWLTEMAWRRAVNLGDPHPEKIAITLGVVDRYGRVLDRVWMRGHFTCTDCNGLGESRSIPGRHVGFTVIVKTHQTLSFSFQGR